MMGIQEVARREDIEIIIGKSILLKRLYCIAAVAGNEFRFFEREAPDYVLDMPELEEVVSGFVYEAVLELEDSERVGMVRLFKKQ